MVILHYIFDKEEAEAAKGISCSQKGVADMAIELFEHNQTAYQAALDMLKDTGKAAIIHPTGTGKSFIGFKLCEDHRDKTICWLSPSEYIFKTQTENLATSRAMGSRCGKNLENIRFCTYAKLASMAEAELQEICPDYIVLDEFHRCGAKVWGQGVLRLLELYPNVPVLGRQSAIWIIREICRMNYLMEMLPRK